jgi:hypothetical protein
VSLYLLPSIDNLIDQMKGTTVYSRLIGDQVITSYELKRTISKTTFKTRLRHYEFTIWSWEWTNSLGVILSLMKAVFHENLDKFFQVLINEHLCFVLLCLRENELYRKLLKRSVYLSRTH